MPCWYTQLLSTSQRRHTGLLLSMPSCSGAWCALCLLWSSPWMVCGLCLPCWCLGYPSTLSAFLRLLPASLDWVRAVLILGSVNAGVVFVTWILFGDKRPGLQRSRGAFSCNLHGCSTANFPSFCKSACRGAAVNVFTLAGTILRFSTRFSCSGVWRDGLCAHTLHQMHSLPSCHWSNWFELSWQWS